MKIGGLQKITLIDYPGKIAATVFISGCNFRCPWCYSPELVLPEKIKKQPLISEKEFFDFLGERQGLLDGVCLSLAGDEPVVVRDNNILKHLPIAELWDNTKKNKHQFYPVSHEYQRADIECLTKSGFKKVEKIIRHKTAELYRVIASPGGYSVKLTGSHSIFVLTKKGLETKSVREIKKGDFLVSANYGIIRHSHRTKIINLMDCLPEILRDQNRWIIAKDYICSKFSNTSKGVPKIVSVDKQFCEFLGYAVAEGSSSYRYGKDGSKNICSYCFSLGDELQLAGKILSLYRNIFKTNSGAINKSKSLSGKNKYNVLVGNILIAELINKLVGRGFKNKHIPTVIFNTSKSNKIAFIKSLAEGDGHWRVRKNHSQEEFSIKTASPFLTADIVFLAKTLDIFSWVEEEKKRVGHEKSFRIVISSNDLDKLNIKKNIKTKYFFDTRVKGIPKILIDLALRGQKRISLEKIEKWIDLSNMTTAKKNIGLRFGFLTKEGKISDKLKRIYFFKDLVKDWDIKEVKSIEKIKLKKNQYVYDLVVPDNHSFVGGVGSFLLHNTGGEPTMNYELPEFIKKIKKLGYLVKLDTNGSNPDLLKSLVNRKLIDYVALDIKGPKNKYKKITGGRANIKNIEESIDFLKKNKIDYEFRTTVSPVFLEKKDILEIARWIYGAKRYYLQNFRPEKTLDPKLKKIKPYPNNYLLEIQKAISPFFEVCRIR